MSRNRLGPEPICLGPSCRAVETCKLNGIEPRSYLTGVLTATATAARHRQSRIMSYCLGTTPTPCDRRTADDWTAACHVYRHVLNETEKTPPTEAITILMVSQDYVRALACRAVHNPE
ncbi:transposase domain-containing protein (plasmid) [Thioclava sp. 'Guangxiensis']|uniref:transposase domain-containing protein n=1 Tax=Thioclava sp. 'Guangxiensis' TaxID=3149044 RepID=UPI0032C4A2A3